MHLMTMFSQAKINSFGSQGFLNETSTDLTAYSSREYARLNCNLEAVLHSASVHRRHCHIRLERLNKTAAYNAATSYYYF